MTTVTAPAPPPDPTEYKLTVEQYLRMIEVGILSEDDPVEFVEGVLVQKMTRKPPHDSTLDRLEDALRVLLPAEWRLRGQKAVDLADGQPEPDVAIVRGPTDRYDDHHPTPAEIAFVAEVAESSLYTDRGRKLRSYVRAGIAVYWIVNLDGRIVEVYTGPNTPSNADPRYRSRTDFGPGQLVPVVIAGTQLGSVSVDVILPRV